MELPVDLQAALERRAASASRAAATQSAAASGVQRLHSSSSSSALEFGAAALVLAVLSLLMAAALYTSFQLKRWRLRARHSELRAQLLLADVLAANSCRVRNTSSSRCKARAFQDYTRIRKYCSKLVNCS